MQPIGQFRNSFRLVLEAKNLTQFSTMKLYNIELILLPNNFVKLCSGLKFKLDSKLLVCPAEPEFFACRYFMKYS